MLRFDVPQVWSRVIRWEAFLTFVVCGVALLEENAGAKMFANKVLFLASSVAALLLVAGSPMWAVPFTALIVFSFMEWAFAFCAGCWAYGLWYARFPPKSG